MRALPILVGVAVALAFAGVARADAEEDLAERYAPVVRLVEQREECGPGEPFRPSDIDAFLDEETVSLRGPWKSNDLVKIAPSGEDLGQGLYEYNLDFPGNALRPGCDYERWARRVTADTEPTVYAHVATDPAHPDRLSLQYWFFYAFNDWNNLHEGDWEMIQLVFPAASAEEALETEPLEVGYSQHEGAERAEWGDDKLELVDGTHPVVYPAAGSHANFYEDALFLGRSAEQGVGCDDTTGPSITLRPDVRTIPGDAAAAQAAYPWIAFEGRWGERQEAFYNGPTGPNLKLQWAEPITWAEVWRDNGYAVPAGGAFGTDATDFFCGAVEAGSNLVLRIAESPTTALAVLAGFLVLVVYVLTRTPWRPTAPLRVARRRSWGQTLTASWRMYTSRPLLFLGIGLLAVPISFIIAGIQWVLFSAGSIVGIDPYGEGGGFRVGLGGRDRHRVDAPHPGLRPGGEYTGDRRDRRGARCRAHAGLPHVARQREAADRRSGDRRDRRHAPDRSRSSSFRSRSGSRSGGRSSSRPPSSSSARQSAPSGGAESWYGASGSRSGRSSWSPASWPSSPARCSARS